MPKWRQFLAFQQFGDDERRSLVGADVVDRQDVRMIERRGGMRFLLEAAQQVGDMGQRCGQNFDRHLAPQPFIARAIDDASAVRCSGALGRTMDVNCKVSRYSCLKHKPWLVEGSRKAPAAMMLAWCSNRLVFIFLRF